MRKIKIKMNKKNIFIIIFVILCVFAMYIFKQENKKEEIENKKELEVKIYNETPVQEEELVILNFTERNCEACGEMELILDDVVQEYNGVVRLRIANIYEELRITRQYDIKAVPTQIFLDLNGNVLYRNEGSISKTQLKKIIEEYRGKIDE